MVILYFVLGSIFTLALLALGGYLGYLLGKKELEGTIQKISTQTKIRQAPKELSGPVKTITPKEQALEREKSFVDKLAGYVEPDRPLT
jgi:hypothetical protein